MLSLSYRACDEYGRGLRSIQWIHWKLAIAAFAASELVINRRPAVRLLILDFYRGNLGTSSTFGTLLGGQPATYEIAPTHDKPRFSLPESLTAILGLSSEPR